uniref:Uncharacterized protein n=1 Tax=Malurus cyaneus samueli TaxID=2593467 RepID=A0A8C5T567_9PASS
MQHQPLELLVRSPAQRHRDLRLSAEPAWTVRRLKTELRRLLGLGGLPRDTGADA